MRWSLRRGAGVLVAGAVLATGSGCGLLSNGAYELPLPGGADLGSDPITLTANFSDVLDLVPQSSVRVDNVAVGRVTKITLAPDEQSAQVELKVNGEVPLPVGTVARLQNTSLLGEKFVALLRPQGPADGPALESGDRLGQEQTSQAAEVEQVLGALSMVLNGGDVGKFQEISQELQQVTDGRTGQVRSALEEIHGFVSVLNSRRGAITAALDGLGDLAATLKQDRGKIATALDGLSPGLASLADQRTQFVSMLGALDRLAKVTVQTLDTSQEDIVADLRALAPILDRLAAAGANLPKALEILLTYPFPDSVLGAIKEDYLNVFITTNYRTPATCSAQGCAWPQATSGRAATYKSAGRKSVPNLLPPTSSPLPGLPAPTVSVPTRKPTPTTTPSTPFTTSSESPTPDAPSGASSPTGSPEAGE
ncbi:MCE family protein [Nocardioides marmoriginsengisoli]|nr:MCE family protein [Nocardioides marmoriginsengisoli]